jgi:hypothetical protein
LLPTPLPVGSISTAFSTSSNSFGFANAVTVDLSATSGSATLVYQVDRTGNAITVSSQDITNASTYSKVAGLLTVGTPVKVYGIPQPDGSIKAYVLFYYTGTPSQ